MSQTNNPSGAEILESLQVVAQELRFDGEHDTAETVESIRKDVAAPIASNAELTGAHAATERDACLQADRANELQSRLAAMTADRDALAADNLALREDAERWQEVSDKAWFIDAAAYVYGLRTGTFEPTPEEDEVIAVIDAARAARAIAKDSDDSANESAPVYLIQACIAGRWSTVGNRVDKSAADTLAKLWAAETSHEYRVIPGGK